MYKTINLQLFAEDETPASNEQEITEVGGNDFSFLDELPEDTNDGEDEETDEPEQQEEELDFDVEFLGKPTRLKKSEAKTYLQKGLNYDHVLEKASNAEAELAQLREQVAQQEVERLKEATRQDLIDKGFDDPDIIIDVINNSPVIKKAEEILTAQSRQIEIDRQKEAVKSKRFFKDIESDIDALIKQNPKVDVSTAYSFIVGNRIDELIDKETTAAKKTASADLQDKLKRGTSNISDSTERKAKPKTEFGSALDKAFGLK